MSAPGSPPPSRPRIGTTVVLAGSLAFVGLLSGLPFGTGAALGVIGAALSYRWRAEEHRRLSGLELAPCLGALCVLLLASPAGAGTELFGGLAVLAFLLWLADDPRVTTGAIRRAAAPLGVVGLVFAFAWVVPVAFAGSTENVGLAGLLAAAGLLIAGGTVVALRAREPAATA